MFRLALLSKTLTFTVAKAKPRREKLKEKET